MWKVHLECPTPPAYLPTEDVEGKRTLCRKQHFQVEEQDRKFGSHHHQRLRVMYSTASMRRFKRLPGFTTMPSFECRFKVGNSVRTFNEACM